MSSFVKKDKAGARGKEQGKKVRCQVLGTWDQDEKQGGYSSPPMRVINYPCI